MKYTISWSDHFWNDTYKIYVWNIFPPISYQGKSRWIWKWTALDFLSNCIFLSGSNSSGDPFYECMDSYPGNVFTGFYIVVNVILFLPLNCWILWLVWRNKGVVWSDIIILNQSVSEIICGISLTFFCQVLCLIRELLFSSLITCAVHFWWVDRSFKPFFVLSATWLWSIHWFI